MTSRRGPLRARRSAPRIGWAVATLAGLLAGCGDDVRGRQGSHVAAADAGRAEAALRDYGCTGCHTIPGVRGADAWVGPPLFAWSERSFIAGVLPNEPDNLVLFLVNPQVVKPGSAMPATGISTEEARDVAAYLYTLR